MSEKKKALDMAESADIGLMDNDKNYIINFYKPYLYEGESYESIDLSGLEDVKAADMIEAQKVLSRSGELTSTPELSMNYACLIAHRVTGKPIEFFYNLPAKEAVKLKNLVSGFFYSRD